MSTQNSALHWKDRPFPELIRLAWPITVSMLSYSTMTLVDTLFVGHFGRAALTAVGLAGVTAFTLICFGFGLLRSVKVLTSQAVGSNQLERLSGILATGLWTALFLGAACIALGHFVSGLLPAITESKAAGQMAQSYFGIRILVSPLVLVAVALREGRHGEGDAKGPMRAALIANAANIGLDYLFIFKLGWGVPGAAWASVVATGIEASELVRLQRHRFRGLFQVRWRQFVSLWRIGLPTGTQMTLELGAFTLLTGMFASMGDLQGGSHQIGLQVAHFSFLPVFAVGEAASVLAGQAVGGRRDALVNRVARHAMSVAGVYTLLCALVISVFAQPIAELFTSDAELISTAVSLLYVVAVFQLFDGANIVVRCVLRGTGDVMFPAVLGIVVAWFVTPPLAYLLGFQLGWGVAGGWIALGAETAVASFILWRRLVRNGWHPAAERCRTDLAAEYGTTGAATTAPDGAPKPQVA